MINLVKTATQLYAMQGQSIGPGVQRMYASYYYYYYACTLLSSRMSKKTLWFPVVGGFQSGLANSQSAGS